MKPLTLLFALALVFTPAVLSAQEYVPDEGNLKARKEFSSKRLGIFIHWGVYSVFGQGEWYLQNSGISAKEYAKALNGFYPSRFNADKWVDAFLDAGAGYVTFTSRHHDGFSMYDTATSDYDIVDGTPYGKDVLAALSSACHSKGLALHVYYSLVDWYREDYPLGQSGHKTGRDPSKGDYDSYFGFMKNQVKEILQNYHPRALWFDGVWDHRKDPTPFDWRMSEFYRYIHSIDPACLIGNNHHITPFEGEDFQLFERDLPGENTAGFSAGQKISLLPLEMCQTMNRSWGYCVTDSDYKSVDELVRLLVRAASKNSNLLLNIGPQPDGNLPDAALERLKGLGEWMRTYAPTIDGTSSSPIPEQPWGVTTMRDGELFLHVLSPESLPSNGLRRRLTVAIPEGTLGSAASKPLKPKSVISFADGKPLSYSSDKEGFLSIDVPVGMQGPDYVIVVKFNQK